jgi:hypothetical protein
MDIKTKYDELCNIPSDINEHLPTLYRYATNSEIILELGVKTCISSWAFAYGLLNNNSNNKKLILNNNNKCNINDLLYTCNNLTNNIDIKYKWINDLELNLNFNVDLTFINTWHVYGQLKLELEKFSKITNKYIILHNTTIDEIYGESLRSFMNISEQVTKSGFSINDITMGLGKAISEFLQNNNNWVVEERYINNNGLTILKKV